MENNRAKEIIQQSQLKDREDNMKFTITEMRTMSAKWTYTIEAESEAEAMDQFLENADIEPDGFILEPRDEYDEDEVFYEIEEIKD